MYFELTAPDQNSFNAALWSAEIIGLDPEYIDGKTLTFSIGTGSIEKVSNIRDKYNLIETYWSEYEKTGYQEKHVRL